MVRYLLLVSVMFLAVACSPADAFFGLDNPEGTSMAEGISAVADTAGAAGIPFAGLVTPLLTMAGGIYAGVRGKGKEKMKNNANYHAVKAVDEGAHDLAKMLREGTLNPQQAAEALEKLTMGTVKTVHSAYGVFDLVKKDIDKMKSKNQMTEG